MFLNIRTEYSFKEVYGPLDRIVSWLKEQNATAASISDKHNTFGHVPWINACKKADIKPVLGSTFSVVVDAETKDKTNKNVAPAQVSVVALSNHGLKELYELIKTSYGQFYYHPRISYEQLNKLSHECAVIVGTGFDWTLKDRDMYALAAARLQIQAPKDVPRIAGQDNRYVYPNDDIIYSMLMEQSGAYNHHLKTEDEWFIDNFDYPEALDHAKTVLQQANTNIEQAPMVSYPGKTDDQLHKMCIKGALELGVDLEDPVYSERLKRELDLIAEKEYEDYFLVVADLVAFAKSHMLVGPSRGSSAGSLVCYLCGITTVDPIPFGLLFERFIDINRSDLPDIDIDFPDRKRQLVIDYLSQKYGRENVTHIGTISRLMPRSAIGLFAKGLKIPAYETSNVKDAIIDRFEGDEGAGQQIKDTFDQTEAGKDFIKKYPKMRLVENIEGHANHSGVHAAGIIVCNRPITDYAGVDARQDVAMLDKKEAEALNLLKIDVLGLRTLSILEECCDDVGIAYNDLYKLPLDDPLAYEVLNSMKLTGIFQFEGAALQNLTRTMGVHKFDDITALTSLARPGPLLGGGAAEFVQRRTGKAPVLYFADHPTVTKLTADEYGTLVYQEQVMRMCRELGNLSWADVSAVRKTMSKSLGAEQLDQYREQFVKGAVANGLHSGAANEIWKAMVTFGGYAFNKSHAVAYGMISYYCAYLKAHHPLHFAKANLNHSRDQGQALRLLREFELDYIPIDPDKSTDRWEIHEGKLLGPLTNIHGLGKVKARDIMRRRDEGVPLTPGQCKLLTEPKTELDELYPGEKLWGEYYRDPTKLYRQFGGEVTGTKYPIQYLKDVEHPGNHTFIGRITDKKLRVYDNRPNVTIVVEDDTDTITCSIGAKHYESMGRDVFENGKAGIDWFIINGDIRNNGRRIYVNRIRKLNAQQKTHDELQREAN